MEELYLEEVSTIGCILTSDGWSNTNNKPLLNTLMVTPKGEWFLNAVDLTGYVKSADYIATEILKSAELVGVQNVIQIVTNNAANCKAGGKKIEELYPSITWSGCGAHAMDLCLEDIGKCNWAELILRQGCEIVKVIGNHHKSLAIFRTNSMFELLKPAETRFAQMFIVLERLQVVRLNLEEIVTCQAWRDWVISLPSSVKLQADNIKEKVLCNDFWVQLGEIVAVCAPILKVLRLADSASPTCGKFYRAFQVATLSIAELELAETSYYKKQVVLTALRSRFEFVVFDLHYAGYVLDPKFMNHAQGEEAQVMDGWFRVVDKLIPKLVDRVQCLVELGTYKSGAEAFSREVVRQAASKMLGYMWWKEYGATCPHMQQLAIKVLAQPISASSCEQNRSSFEFIHSKKRNRLTIERATSLVLVFSNLCLLKKIIDVDFSEDFVPWAEENEM